MGGTSLIVEEQRMAVFLLASIRSGVRRTRTFRAG